MTRLGWSVLIARLLARSGANCFVFSVHKSFVPPFQLLIATPPGFQANHPPPGKPCKLYYDLVWLWPVRCKLPGHLRKSILFWSLGSKSFFNLTFATSTGFQCDTTCRRGTLCSEQCCTTRMNGRTAVLGILSAKIPVIHQQFGRIGAT